MNSNFYLVGNCNQVIGSVYSIQQVGCVEHYKILGVNIEGKSKANKRFSHTATQAKIYQTLTNRAIEIKYAFRCSSITCADVHVMTLVHYDGVRRRPAIQLPVTLKNLTDAAETETVDHLVKINYRERFCVDIPNSMMKYSCHC